MITLEHMGISSCKPDLKNNGELLKLHTVTFNIFKATRKYSR